MKKRTIERKSKEGFLNSMAKNLGLKSKQEEEKKETVREFDDLIETLRTGEAFSHFNFLTLYSFASIFFLTQKVTFFMAKNTSDRGSRKVAIHHREIIERTVTTHASEFIEVNHAVEHESIASFIAYGSQLQHQKRNFTCCRAFL